MKLMSWNVNGRTGAAARKQVDEVRRCPPDVIALQEVVMGSLDVWLEGLRREGYSGNHSPIEALAAPSEAVCQRPESQGLVVAGASSAARGAASSVSAVASARRDSMLSLR